METREAASGATQTLLSLRCSLLGLKFFVEQFIFPFDLSTSRDGKSSSTTNVGRKTVPFSHRPGSNSSSSRVNTYLRVYSHLFLVPELERIQSTKFGRSWPMRDFVFNLIGIHEIQRDSSKLS